LLLLPVTYGSAGIRTRNPGHLCQSTGSSYILMYQEIANTEW